ncbi:unnamed protein product [Parascedosporium putredinis]|uniref:Trafficking protein particle complex subunit 6B n=1 Tax=Parascedosporium putredinis TaxID=1442378 RepID=A0A9P1GWZ3_9PEZI|nr:unnamed protein product [Parascedosporium putredinis]CAI7988563.1 unnamed protein product [Parascedosporium putredinis]
MQISVGLIHWDMKAVAPERMAGQWFIHPARPALPHPLIMNRVKDSRRISPRAAQPLFFRPSRPLAAWTNVLWHDCHAALQLDRPIRDLSQCFLFRFLLIELVPLAYRVTNELEPPSDPVPVGDTFSRERPRFNDTLDVIKFVCKDLWSLVFRKQVDNLKTNHCGVYVLTDNAFRPLSRMSTEAGGQAVVRAAPFLLVPCGIIRGALAAMGTNATVQADASKLPAAVFRIRTIPQKS